MDCLECTPAWLADRIVAFIDQIEGLDSEALGFDLYQENVGAICATEMGYLRDVLGVAELVNGVGLGQDIEGSLNTFVSYLTSYRSAIKETFVGRLNASNSREKMTGDIGAIRLERSHVALRFLAVSDLERKARKQRDSAAKMAKITDRLLINPAPIYAKSVELLSVRSYAARALAIAAMTGRRMIEILKTGEFARSESPHTLRFRGQAKTKSKTRPLEWYEIPTLIEPDQAIDALQSIRDDRPQFLDEPNRRINQITSKTVGEQFSRHYRRLLPEGSEPKSLRAAYAVTCWERYGRKICRDEPLYYSRILGHDDTDTETSGYYRRFFIPPELLQ